MGRPGYHPRLSAYIWNNNKCRQYPCNHPDVCSIAYFFRKVNISTSQEAAGMASEKNYAEPDIEKKDVNMSADTSSLKAGGVSEDRAQ